MVTFDVNRNDPTLNNVEVRRHIRSKRLGRLMGTYQGYELLADGGDSFSFTSDTTYIGEISLTKMENGLMISAKLSNSQTMTEFSHLDKTGEVNNFGMLAFHVNSKTFGSSSTPGKSDNGIEFTNVRLEVIEK